MKKMIKPLMFFVLAAVFVSLLIIPSHLPAAGAVLMPGEKIVIDNIDTCACPDDTKNCQCLIIKPPVQ